jgi:hypothetical protein
MGRVEGVIDDGADRCAVGGWCSPSAWRVRLELRGGLFRTITVEWAYIRWFPRRSHPSQLPGACDSRTHGSVRHDEMGSGGFHVVVGHALDGLSCHLFFVAHAFMISAWSDPRHARMLSLSSTHCTHPINTIGCVVCVEAREERRGPGRGWEKPCGGWIERDGSSSCFLCFFWPRVSTHPDRR